MNLKKLSKFVIPLLTAVVIGGIFIGSKPNEPVEWKKFSGGLEASLENGKKSLVYVYTDWCGWCKKMESQTLYNQDVVSYLKDKFVTVKLNAESGEKHSYLNKTFTEREIAREFRITGYPAVVFFDEKNEPITVLPGYVDASNFMVILEYISENHYKTIQFDDFMKQKEGK